MVSFLEWVRKPEPRICFSCCCFPWVSVTTLKHPLCYRQRCLCDCACPGSIADSDQGIVDGTGCASPRWYLDIARRRAHELRLIHIPNRVVDPDHFVKLGAVAANIENGYLGPVGVLVHVEIIAYGSSYCASATATVH